MIHPGKHPEIILYYEISYHHLWSSSNHSGKYFCSCYWNLTGWL